MQFAKVNLFEGYPVFALRYEEFLFSRHSQRKVAYLRLQREDLGTKKLTFIGVTKKATLISLHYLLRELVCSVLKGTYAHLIS